MVVWRWAESWTLMINPQKRAKNESQITKEQTIIAQLQAQFPEVRWRQAPRFSFRPPHTVCLGRPQPHYGLLALHELGHCLEKHRDFCTEIGRLQMERAAWERARCVWRQLNLGEQGLIWDEDFVETQLDTYRDWLHARSRCPRCSSTRFQTPDGAYHCPFCGEFASRTPSRRQGNATSR